MSNPNQITEQDKQIAEVLFSFDNTMQSIRKSNEPEHVKSGKQATNLLMTINDIQAIFDKPKMVKNQNTITLTQKSQDGEFELIIAKSSSIAITSFGSNVFMYSDLQDLKEIQSLLNAAIPALEKNTK